MQVERDCIGWQLGCEFLFPHMNFVPLTDGPSDFLKILGEYSDTDDIGLFLPIEVQCGFEKNDIRGLGKRDTGLSAKAALN